MTTTKTTMTITDLQRPHPRRLYELGKLLNQLNWHEQQASLLLSPDQGREAIRTLRSIERVGRQALAAEAWQDVGDVVKELVDGNHYQFPILESCEAIDAANRQLEEEFRMGDFERARAQWCRRIMSQDGDRLVNALAARLAEREFHQLELGRIVDQIIRPADVFQSLYEEWPAPESERGSAEPDEDAEISSAATSPTPATRPANFGGISQQHSLEFIGNTERQPGELPVPNTTISELRTVWKNAGLPASAWPLKESEASVLDPTALFHLIDRAVYSLLADAEQEVAASLGKLTQKDRDILTVLLEANGNPMIGEQIMGAIEKLRGKCSDGSTKQRLAELVKRSILKNVRSGQAAGYTLAIDRKFAVRLVAAKQS